MVTEVVITMAAAGSRYLVCPFCGRRDDIKVKVRHSMNDYGFADQTVSLICTACNLTYGEDGDGNQMYDNESALIADWNRRRY